MIVNYFFFTVSDNIHIYELEFTWGAFGFFFSLYFFTQLHFVFLGKI